MSEYDGFCSKINDKPVDAIGHMVFGCDFDHFKSPFYIEKVFGLIVKEKNILLKFKLVVKDTEKKSRRIKFKLIYLSEEIIDCKFEEYKETGLEVQEQKQLKIGDTLVRLVYKPADCMIDDSRIIYFSFSIGLSFDVSSQMQCNFMSRKFNDQSTSDFIVECQNEKFYVHEMILKDQSEYFGAILRSDCLENKRKKLRIDDFEPEAVEALLRHIYNGAVRTESIQNNDFTINLMRIADKYNFTNLYDAIDSDLAQSGPRFDTSISDKDAVKKLTGMIPFCEKTGAPKLSAMLFLWKQGKNSVKSANGLSDRKWSMLMRKNPNFALVAANAASREDYQTWLKQHKFWDLTVQDVEKNDFALIVGPLGRMPGAIECSQN